MQPSTLSAAIALLAVLLPSGAALAAPPADVRAMAEQLYQDAYDLAVAGRYDEACPKLEESDRLDPANGTKLELARCYENTRRPASAWVLYATVADADHLSGKNAEREELARARALALEPTLPMLTIIVPSVVASLPGLEITRDGVVLGRPAWGTAVPVDIGDHRITVSAAGKLTWEGRATVARLGERAEILIPPLRDAGPRPRGAVAEPVHSDGSTRRAWMLVTGGVGLAGIALGSAFGATAMSTWSDVKSDALTECRDPVHFKGCSVHVANRRADASLFATVSTIGFVAGGAAIVGTAILALSGPSRPRHAGWVQFTPSLGPGGAGGLLRGTF